LINVSIQENTPQTPSQWERVQEKVARLGQVKQELEQQVGRLRAECESLYKINGELQHRIDELNEKRLELELRQSPVGHVQEEVRVRTKERISELVKEIDDCITLLNT
jgi:predicted RNase H-like nuclease (RuvC/YqgF family)